MWSVCTTSRNAPAAAEVVKKDIYSILPEYEPVQYTVRTDSDVAGGS